jgi:hypothetical protein
LFKKYSDEIIEKLNNRAEGKLGAEVIDGIIQRDKKESLKCYIDPNLEYLIKRGGPLVGMKVSCRNCGSNKCPFQVLIMSSHFRNYDV